MVQICLNPKDVNDLFEEIHAEFIITSIVDKNEVILIIIELRCDKEKVLE